ncbi:B3 domain-containing protein REM-like 1 isoform X1 [Eutrema salsugineum]|uniref:B3 domain-containing protein REM-like 1 isoform X1 n=1 Tax=Eutrema salsugineum TaxID=72664 RepID=UPI000CED6728|nr:B3 domain-containing protein REM-like 1 isoform X1 [Eutrema salsugineum]
MIFESAKSSFSSDMEGDMMFQVSNLGPNCSEIRDVPATINNIGNISMKNNHHPRKEASFISSHGDDLDNIEFTRKKKTKKNNPETEAFSTSDHSCFEAHVSATNCLDFRLQDSTSSDAIRKKCDKKYSSRRMVKSYESSEKRFVTFTLAPVDVRHCRLRLPMQFSRENGINKPGKIYLLGNDGSKWLANLLLESRGRMTVGDGWKSFVKANGLKIGESYTLELKWEDTTPVLCLCPEEYSMYRGAGGCSEASEKESLLIQPSSGNEIMTIENIDENRKEESSSWEKEKNHLRRSDSTSTSQNRFLTLTITPDSLRHGRLRIPLQFMRENRMNTPGDITLLGKDGAKWLVSLLLERRGRMSLGKGWKDFAKANGLKTGDSITLESIWEDATPVLSLLRIEPNSDGRQQGEYSIAREKETIFTELSSGESRKYPLGRLDSSLAIQSTVSPEIGVSHHLRIGEIAVFRHEGDMMFQVSDFGPSCCEIRDVLTPIRNHYQENIGSISLKMHPHLRKEAGFSSYDGDDQYNIGIFKLPRKKKVKLNNPGTEAVFSSDRSCFVAHVTASNLHTNALPLPQEPLPQDFSSSDGHNRKCPKNSPTQIISSYSSNEKHLATFTLAPVNVRNCRLRLPMQFTRENGINKPGKIYLLGKDGSKWLANLLQESRGRMTLGDGWKSFVTANGLKTGESFSLKLNWEDTTPVLSLCPAEYSIDSREEGGCPEAREKEPLPIKPSSGKEISISYNNEDENSKEESTSWEREKNQLISSNSSSPSQNRFLTLTITPDSLRHGRLRLPLQFMRENSMNTPGDITLLGKDGAKWLVSLLLERRGRMSLGKGWKDFAKANGLKTGDSITLESIWEDATPVLSLLRIEASNDRGQSEFSKLSLSTGRSSGNKTRKAENNREGSSSGEFEKSKDLLRRVHSSLAIQNRIVMLTLTPEDVRDCKLHLPSQFMRTNGITKPGKITMLGRSGMKWFAYLLSNDGAVALGNGWKGFCEANGVMVGESYILEYIPREDTDHVFKFCSNFGDQIHNW